MKLGSFCIFVFAAGLAIAQRPQTQLPPPPSEVKPPAAPVVSADNAGVPVDPRSFLLGVEDVIQIEVWGDDRLSTAQAIRPDGKITMKLIGDLQAAGLSVERLRDQIKQAVAEIVQRPDVTIKVLQVNSRKFTITGEVYRTGAFPLIAATRVFEALNLAGGFRDFANKGKILIIRDGGKQRFKFNYNEVLKGKHLEQNILLESGDTIYVP